MKRILLSFCMGLALVSGCRFPRNQMELKRTINNNVRSVRNFSFKVRNEGLKRVIHDRRWVVPLTFTVMLADPRSKMDALSALGYMQDTRAVPVLIRALRDRHPGVRNNAAMALGRLKDKRAVRPLIAILEDGYPYVNQFAVTAVGELGDTQATDILIKIFFNESYPQAQWNAASSLGKIKGKKALDALMAGLKSDLLDTRISSTHALVLAGDTSTVDALIEALYDRNPIGKSDVIRALGATKDARAVLHLINYLNVNQSSDAAWSLGSIGDSRAEKALIRAMKCSNPETRGAAARALVKCSKENLGFLILDAFVSEKNQQVRSNMAWALGELKYKPAVKQLIAALSDQNSDAAWALGQVGDTSAVVPLLSLLTSEVICVREYAAKALGNIGDRRAVEPLLELLKDKNQYVRDKAFMSIVQILEANGEPLQGLREVEKMINP